jgi:hypothetical protein
MYSDIDSFDIIIALGAVPDQSGGAEVVGIGSKPLLGQIVEAVQIPAGADTARKPPSTSSGSQRRLGGRPWLGAGVQFDRE